MTRTILFICTGNTCRSPMAEGIARYLIESKSVNLPGTWNVQSAGIAAGSGIYATPEAVTAMKNMNIDISSHISKPVSDSILQSASIIYGMTASQVLAVSQMLPAKGELIVSTLCKDSDIPDPYGMDQQYYNVLSQNLYALILERLKELSQSM